MDMHQVIDALCNVPEVQARYFGTRDGMHMHARHCPASGCVLWVFRFLDIGMMHTIKGRALVTTREGRVCVNNRRINHATEATDLVFKGRLRRFMKRMYQRLSMPGTHG